MPSSSPEALPTVIRIAYDLAPRRVLDVGCGYGKYGVLYREYLELRHCIEDGDAEDPLSGDRVVTIDGIEGWAPYIGSLHELVYDTVYQTDLAEFVERDFEYDLIFMGDVFEHIDKNTACSTILPRLAEAASMGVLISVPAKVREQDAVFGNEFERHRSSWHPRDFREFADFCYCGQVGKHLIAFLSNDEASFRRAHPGHRIRQVARTLRRSRKELRTPTW